MTSKVPPIRLVASPSAETAMSMRLPGTGKGRQVRRDHHRGDVARVELRLVVAGVDAEALQHADQGLPGEDRGAQPVAGAGEPDHQPVAHELVVAHALHVGDVLQPHRLGGGGNRGGDDGSSSAISAQKAIFAFMKALSATLRSAEHGGCERAYATAVPPAEADLRPRRRQTGGKSCRVARREMPGRAGGVGSKGQEFGMRGVAGVGRGGSGRPRARKTRSAASGFSLDGLGSGSAAAETAAASATAAVGLSLLAVQENGGRTGRDAAARRRAASILDELQGLQAELLGGRTDPARLARLAALQDGEEGDRPRTPRGGPRHRPSRPHRTRAAGPAPGDGPIRDSCVKAAPDQRLGSFFPWRRPGNACICPRIA